jgi:S-phase kinase-associated protein 1
VEFLVWEDKHPHTEIEKPLKSSDIKDFMDPWCVKFLDIPNTELFELILRANYMGIPPLLDIACGKVAAMTRNKPVETIRKEFNIVNDFTPEEEAPIIEEQKWLDEA